MAQKVALVADDDPLILELTKTMLEELGCEVVTADSGEAALKKLGTDPRISLLMTDVQMPGMSGYELANLARAGDVELHVVIMSGNDPGDRTGFRFLRKPFSQDHLHEIVGPLVRTQ